MPRLSGKLVERLHLIERLNRGLDRKLTLVSAPAGYGKTTLIVMWLKTIDRQSAWLSLDEYDQNLPQYLAYFIEAVRTIHPKACSETTSLIRAPQIPPVEFLANSIINDISALPEGFILVLDDYHTIKEQAILDLMDRLILYQPAGMHLVLCCRTDPRIPLSLLRGRRQINELRVNDLRFTGPESLILLEQVSRMPVDPEIANGLEERTEGWVTGLQLAAISMRGRNDLRAFLEGFSGETSLMVVDYLMEEVLHQCPEQIQDFLFRTSILNRFCAPLCDAVLGFSEDFARDVAGSEAQNGEYSLTSSQDILRSLERAGLFITPLDEQGGWYRYHHLFQELLRNQLNRLHSSEDINELYCRAGAWFAENDNIDEALQQWLAAGEVDQAALVVEENRIDLFNRQNRYRLESWLSKLPVEVVQNRPALLLIRAWTMQLRSKFDSMEQILQRVEKSLESKKLVLSDTNKRALHGEINSMRSMYWQMERNDIQRSFECAERALRDLPVEFAEARGLALAFLCLDHQGLGRKETAVRLLKSAIDPAYLDAPSKYQALIALSFVYLISGDLDNLLDAARYFLKLGEDMGQMQSIAWANYFLGAVYYEWNELETAEKHFSRVSEQRYNVAFMTIHNSMIGLAKVYQAGSRFGDAQEVIETLRAYTQELHITIYAQQIASMQADIALLQGDLSSAMRWVKSDALEDQPLVALEEPNLTQSRILIFEASASSLDEAQRSLVKRLKYAEDSNNTNKAIKILAHLSLAYFKNGMEDKALDTLKRALSMAWHGGYIRTFVDLGPGMLVVLKLLVAQETVDHTAKEYASLILNAFPVLPAEIDPVRAAWQRSQAIMIHPLTERESEVFLLLAQNLSYREIATQLVVTLNTVKKHANHVYGKLGVNNRAAAIDKAITMQILIDYKQ